MARGRRTVEHPHIERAAVYVADVLSGRRPACQWERLACERWIRDRENEATASFRFEPLMAERICRFVEHLPHTKGAWAARGETIRLEGWQCFVLINAFGWLRRSDGNASTHLSQPRRRAKRSCPRSARCRQRMTPRE